MAVTGVPTARQLLLQTGKKNISKSQVKSITKTKQTFTNLVHTQIKDKTPRVKLQSLRLPKQKVTISEVPKIKKNSMQFKYKEISKKHSSKFTKVTEDGFLIDKFRGKVIGHASFVTDEEIGQYIYENYKNDQTGRIKLPEVYTNKKLKKVYEVESFKEYLKARIESARNDLFDKTSAISSPALDMIERQFEVFKQEDWNTSYRKWKKFGSVIKQYIDEALYYGGSEPEHYRAIKIISEILGSPIKDIDLERMEDTDYSEDIFDEYYGNYGI